MKRPEKRDVEKLQPIYTIEKFHAHERICRDIGFNECHNLFVPYMAHILTMLADDVNSIKEAFEYKFDKNYSHAQIKAYQSSICKITEALSKRIKAEIK